MLYNAKNGVLPLGDSTMEYIRFGSGPKTLVMLPGLGDGLRTMKGTALPMALLYRGYTKDYTVYAFSRKSPLSEGYGIRDMAQDQAQAMDALGIQRADIFGVSMGGMIAQYLAAEHREKVDKLVLTVTCAQPNPILEESVKEWIAQAKAGNHTALMDSNLRRIYSDAYYRRNKWMIPFVGKLTKPRSYDRFFVQANACLNHNSLGILEKINCPVLVIGGEQDKTLGPEPSRELARRISGAKLKMYPQWGHGLYEEAKDFHKILLDFFRKA